MRQCDGKVPSCQRCIDRGLECLGYNRKLEFVYFDGQAKTTPTSSDRENEQSLVRRWSSKPKLAQGTPETGHGIALAPKFQQDFQLVVCSGILDSLAAPQNRIAFVSILQERYTPETPHVSKFRIFIPSWIAQACALATTSADSGMLNNSLLAMSLYVVGKENQQDYLSRSSLKHYSHALKGLRQGLSSGTLEDRQLDISLVTCMACGMYEVSLLFLF